MIIIINTVCPVIIIYNMQIVIRIIRRSESMGTSIGIDKAILWELTILHCTIIRLIQNSKQNKHSIILFVATKLCK